MGLAITVMILIGLVIQMAVPVRAQFLPGVEKVEGETPSGALIPVFRRGNLELAPIFVDGKMVGMASSFISVRLRDESLTNAGKITAANRAYLIHSLLQKYLHAMSLYTKTLAEERGIKSIGAQERILRDQLSTQPLVRDNSTFVALTFPAKSQPEQIYTITRSDIDQVRFESSNEMEIAVRASVLLKRELLDAWRNRQQPQLIAGLIKAAYVVGGLVLLSLLLAFVQRRLLRYQQTLSGQLESELNSARALNPESKATQTAGGFSFVKAPLRRLSLRQRSSAVRLYGILLYWLHWMLWILGVAYIFNLFYFSRPLSNWILGVSILGQLPGQPLSSFPPRDWIVSLGQEATLGAPLLILLLLIVTSVTIRVGNLIVDSSIQKWASAKTDQRLQLRAPTIANAIKSWLQASIYLLFGMVILFQLHQLGTFTQTLAIFAGFLSFALSLASQSLLKDLISGLLILWEDQYSSGDVIIVGAHAGLVEKVGLRVTKLRNLDGELITIPNSSIDVVRNLSSDWSQVNYTIDLNYHADVDQVLQVMADVAEGLHQDPEWGPQILEAPEILGIESLSHAGITIRMIIKTLPLRQWDAGREYRRRLKIALDAAGIDVGVPRLELAHPLPSPATDPVFSAPKPT
jgi:small-conductance mechanosensitive channel